MLEEGWRPSDRYDAEAMTHDCLRPFDQLSAFAQEDVARLVESEEYEKSFVILLTSVCLGVHGRQRELHEGDMHVGMVVRAPDDEDPFERPGALVGGREPPDRAPRLDPRAVGERQHRRSEAPVASRAEALVEQSGQ